jgi:hypothetical protein
MLIQCTKKLLGELKIKPEETIDETPLFSWHANLITVNHRKTIVLVNDSSRYIIILHGLKAKDFKNLDEMIMDSIRETLLGECIKEEVVERFLNYSPKVIYTKTKERSLVAKMNKACDTVSFYANELNSNTIIQSVVSMRASACIVGDGKDSYIHPNEVMYKDLELLVKESVFRCKAVELKVTLGLENRYVWRRVVVPDHITFKKLHDILQIVFDWKDYHLHDYYIFDGDKPFVNLVCSTEDLEDQDDLPIIMETDKILSDYMPKYSRIKYIYDFGDNWEHYIEVEKSIENYSANYPKCLDGEGNTPPEDVGGEYGYEEFLKAISDPIHPEHKSMVDWGKMQGYRDFDIESVNRRLKYSLIVGALK